MTPTILLADSDSREDLRTYLQRLDRAGQPEVRLVTRGRVLAVYGCTQAPRGIIDPLPVVLAMRAFALAAEPDAPLDVTVLGRSVIDRLARLGPDDLELDVPTVSAMAAWAGVLPPLAGWEAAGRIDADSLRQVAAAGIERVAALLPESPGEAVVHSVRSAVWGLEIAPNVPAGAAFAAEAMGFLGDEPLLVSRSSTWIRLSSTTGHVLVRSVSDA